MNKYQFNDRRHFINYCLKVVSNKLNNSCFLGRKEFKKLLRKMWNENKVELIVSNLINSTPQQIYRSLERITKDRQPKVKPKQTGYWGMYSTVSKVFVFGIQEDTRFKAQDKLFKKIGHDSLKFKFVPKKILDCQEHRDMFIKDLKIKEEAK